MKKIYLSALLCAAAAGSQAQINLVTDINVGGSSDPGMLTPFNNKLYMLGKTTNNGKELIAYDGTNPAALAYDLNPGSGYGVDFTSYSDKWPVLDGKMYFIGNNGSTGWELYRYDGSSAALAGAETNPGAGDGATSTTPVAMGGKIYYEGSTAAKGTELYVYDPATNTNSLVADINPGADGSSPNTLIVCNGKLYFRANNGTNGSELYCYNPGNNSTAMVQDINAGVDGSFPYSFYVHNNKLYFIAYTPVNGRELYSYDGTTVTRLTDINPGAGDGVFSREKIIIAFGGKLLLGGTSNGTSSGVFAYDPATNTTNLVYTIEPTAKKNVYGFTQYGNYVYFQGETVASGRELWRTDGNTASMVMDLNPGNADSYPLALTVWNGKLYMNAQNGITLYELYQLTTPDGSTGIASVKLDGSASLAPNPIVNNTTNLHLSLGKSYALQVAVTDISGRTIATVPLKTYAAGSSDVRIDMGNSAAGQYFYRVCDENGHLVFAGKIVK